MKLNVEFIGSVYAKSGYGWAARNYFKALLTQDRIAAGLNPMRWGEFDEEVKDSKFEQYVDIIKTPSLRIYHGNPASKRGVIEQYAGNVGTPLVLLTVWEANLLPPVCVEICNQYDAIIVPTKWNRDTFKTSGVTVPIHVLGHAFDAADYEVPQDIQSWRGDDKYTFYWLGAWVERKNPIGILRAYFHAFPSSEFPVRLILKTGGINEGGVLADIEATRRNMNLPSYPTVVPIVDSEWTDAQIKQMHMDCQCYVSLARGEGWDVPLFEAALYGNDAVYSNFGGHSWAQYTFGNGMIPVPCQESPAFGDPTSSLYSGLMRWGDPNLVIAAEAMRHLASQRHTKDPRTKLKLKPFSLQNIGKEFANILMEVNACHTR